MKVSLYQYCVEFGKEYLLSEWHPLKNAPSTPQNTAKTSRKRVWWVCECGHQWQTQVASRLGGTLCPFCYRLKLEEKRKYKEKNYAKDN